MISCTIVFQVFIPAKLAFTGEIAKSLLFFSGKLNPTHKIRTDSTTGNTGKNKGDIDRFSISRVPRG
jgi:hypothetical protein